MHKNAPIIHPQTQSLWLTHMANHHLVISFLFLIVRHMYRTNFGIGHDIKDMLDAHIHPFKSTGNNEIYIKKKLII